MASVSGPLSAMMAFTFSPISAKAWSQLIASNEPWSFFLSGSVRRSAEYAMSAYPYPRAQSVPSQ